MNFQIRLAQPYDARGIAEVHVRSWQHAYQDIFDPTDLASLDIIARAQRWKEIIIGETETNWVVEWDASEDCAEINDEHSDMKRIIGFASTGLARDADMTNKQELYALYLDPAYFDQGIGYTVINQILGDQPAVLWVLMGNERAYQFYQRQGFYPDGMQGMYTFQGKDYAKLRMQRD